MRRYDLYEINIKFIGDDLVYLLKDAIRNRLSLKIETNDFRIHVIPDKLEIYEKETADRLELNFESIENIYAEIYGEDKTILKIKVSNRVRFKK